MKTKKELLTLAGEKHKRNQELLAKGAGITAEDIAEVKKLNGEIEGLKAEITQAEEAELALTSAKQHGEWLSEPSQRLPMPSEKGAEMLGYTPAGETIIDHANNQILSNGAGIFGEKVWKAINETAYKTAYRKYIRRGEQGLSNADFKDLELGLDPQGGYLSPPEFIMRLISRLPTPTRVNGLVTNISTSRDSIVMPKVNYVDGNDLYATGFRVTWTGEDAVDGEQDVNDTNLFGEQRIQVYTSMLSSVITRDMAEDAAFDLEGWLSNKFGETVDLLYDNMIINGTGAGQPAGLLANIGGTDQPAYVAGGDANNVLASSIINLAYALPEQYDDNARWLFNKTSTAKAIAGLTDSNGRYLFGMGVQDSGLATARPKELVGYPFVYSGFMPAVAANAYPVVFGDFSGYYKVNRVGLSIQVLRETRAKQNQLELVGRLRFGGKVVEGWKLKAMKIATS